MSFNWTNIQTQRGIGARLGRTEQSVEVAVFLFLIVPSLALSLFVRSQGNVDFPFMAAAIIFRDLALVSLILFFLWRNSEPVRFIGWNGRHFVREVILGVVCFVPFFLSAAFLERALLRVGLSTPATPPSSLNEGHSPAQVLLAFVLVGVVALAEETIFRGYLLLRFPAVLRSMTASVLLSAAIFAIGHGYEGSAGLVTVGFMGLVLSLVYLWRGTLVAPMVMHFLQDFLGIVLLPLWGLK